uniref:Leucine-rich repeats and calponin homology (CH) domain containing 4 n=1 Tax=Xenopus tropicalis TaxID=8364 RepID=A0A803JHR3_XENTR
MSSASVSDSQMPQPVAVCPPLDLSKNRLSEVPADICQLVSLESLNLYHNCLRFIPPALSNLQVLTHLNISRNLLPSLPPCICRLPLTVLIASNNKLGALPEEIGTMTSLRQLDVSCNDLQALPPQMGSLGCLRDLNARRNQLSALPEELSELPLIRLDLSCNRITHIPVCYRHLRHLQTVILENNPLQYPPAQICLKGKVHIFKYLNIEACSKPVSELGVKLSRPTSLTTCLTEEIYSSRPYGGLDSGFNSVDSGSKRWSGNESADELTDLSLRIAGFAGDSKQLREKLNGTEGDTEHTDVESTNEEEEETKSDCGLQMTPQDKQKPEHHSTPRSEEKTMVSGAAPSPVSPTVGRPDPPTEERRRPETLLLWRERERQQLQQRQEAPRRQSADRKERWVYWQQVGDLVWGGGYIGSKWVPWQGAGILAAGGCPGVGILAAGGCPGGGYIGSKWVTWCGGGILAASGCPGRGQVYWQQVGAQGVGILAAGGCPGGGYIGSKWVTWCGGGILAASGCPGRGRVYWQQVVAQGVGILTASGCPGRWWVYLQQVGAQGVGILAASGCPGRGQVYW